MLIYASYLCIQYSVKLVMNVFYYIADGVSVHIVLVLIYIHIYNIIHTCIIYSVKLAMNVFYYIARFTFCTIIILILIHSICSLIYFHF